VKLKDNEVTVFSWIVYRSRKDRDGINKLVMADPRLASMMDPKALPFDGKRMFFGGGHRPSALMSAASSTGFGAPYRTTASIARPTTSVLSTTVGINARSNGNSGRLSA